MKVSGFNPRPLCRERLKDLRHHIDGHRVSIHAPYAGSDSGSAASSGGSHEFQSTPPMQGATLLRYWNEFIGFVSIHAPYAGSDFINGTADISGAGFQSTPPMQGATHCFPVLLNYLHVSIHAPYAGSDVNIVKIVLRRLRFQSTPPMQGATILCYRQTSRYHRFNPRPLCRERRETPCPC